MEKYFVVNLECDDEHYEIMLSPQQLNAVNDYYNILDNIGVAQSFTRPLTKKEFQEIIEKN
jgi:hypothetical protein